MEIELKKTLSNYRLLDMSDKLSIGVIALTKKDLQALESEIEHRDSSYIKRTYGICVTDIIMYGETYIKEDLYTNDIKYRENIDWYFNQFLIPYVHSISKIKRYPCFGHIRNNKPKYLHNTMFGSFKCMLNLLDNPYAIIIFKVRKENDSKNSI